jgi:ABC-type branched-subunit amino acid transport system permease subunit
VTPPDTPHTGFPPTRTRGRQLVRVGTPVLTTAVLLATVPVLVGRSGYLMALATTMLVLAGYATGLNVIFGSTGQLFLCLGALAGVSGYGAVLLADDGGWPVAAGLVVGTLVASALGAAFSWVAVRRHLDAIFVGIVTLAFSLVFTNLVQGLRDVTGGETGRVVVAGGTLLRDRVVSYYVLLAAVVVFLAIVRALEGSHVGWAFRALRDDPVAAALAGVDVARYRIAAAALGSAMVGLMGALFAFHEGFISPTSYAFAHVDIRTLVVLAFGGIGSLLGPVVGAVAVSVLDELLRPLGQLRLAVYGAALLVLFLGFPRGVVPAVTDLVARRRRRG